MVPLFFYLLLTPPPQVDLVPADIIYSVLDRAKTRIEALLEPLVGHAARTHGRAHGQGHGGRGGLLRCSAVACADRA